MADTGLLPLYEEKFSTLLELKLQQKGSKLRSKVNEMAFSGAKLASPLQLMDAVKLAAPVGRYAPKAATPHVFTRRWVSPVDKEIDQLVDSFDELKTSISPQSQFVEAAAMDAGRFIDDQIIAAATGAATIGSDAGSLSSEAFDTTAFRVAVDFGSGSGNVGLTVAKLNEAARIFEHYENDLGMDIPTLVIGSNQHSDLRNQAQVTSSDFNRNGGVLTDGRVTRFMGFDIVVMERLPFVTTNQRGCFAFVKSGICLGMWRDIKTRISIRNDLSSEPFDVNTQLSCGATRTQLGKVVQIVCADTTGASITP